MRYLREPLGRASEAALAQVTALGGGGGLIAVDSRGRIAMPFTTEGMYRGCVRADGKMTVAVYRQPTCYLLIASCCVIARRTL
jgi:beta-aspartyl-peptidase (threonine type)